MYKKRKEMSYVILLIPILLYAKQWESNFQISTNQKSMILSFYNGRCIACNDSIVHAVWMDGRDGNFEIYYARSTDYGIGQTQNMGYVVYATKEDGITKIRFSAFDTLRTVPYYTTVIDVGDEDCTVSSPSIAVTPKDLIHIVWQKNDLGHNTSSIYYKTTLDGVTPDAIRQGIFPDWTDSYQISTQPPLPLTEPASNPFIEAQGEWVYVVWRGPNEDGNPEFGEVWQREGIIEPGNIPQWRRPRNVSQSPDAESNYPTMSTGTVVVWQESLPERHQIYGEIQGQIRNLSDNEYDCKYPHCNIVPTEPWYQYMWRLITVWTQEKSVAYIR